MTQSPSTVDVGWRRKLSRRVLVTDFVALILAIGGTQLAWFSTFGANLYLPEGAPFDRVGYSLLSALIVVAWMWSLGLNDSRSDRVLGTGIAEYRRVFDASFRVFGAVAIVALLLKLDFARGYILLAFPFGLVLLIINRWAWGGWLQRARARGHYLRRALLVGSLRTVTQIAAEMSRQPAAGYLVVGVCLPASEEAHLVANNLDVEVVGTIDTIEIAMVAADADTVVVTGADELPPDRVKQISWSLETGNRHLVLTPSMVDVAGPRLQVRPTAGLPLIHVETPRLSAGQRFMKRTFDIVVSLVLMVLLSPLMAVIAVIVRTTSSGSAIFAQQRVGRDGREFRMFKFRSMVDDAGEKLASLIASRDAGNEVMFKMNSDPRVTPVGRWLRKHSVDELPQLANVLRGTMSLVGPRPPLPSEVAQYADHVHRRFLMKPGMTGLWQVSGRSSLSWEDTVRLDLSYVENYSAFTDAVILAKTLREVVAPGSSAR
ncbi:sugar transferase [uncultured Microbacterium sp.]|uniref:sugar transferase n=1 Tax=uncultured Microbacterium sp. TaxID=191216 RepID=UPI00263342DB|nr:sugar transferase [uncultured Microbacterium sp.]